MGVPKIKENHVWCRHAAPGHGCKIYADRPEECRSFSCMWLLDRRFGEHWFPAKAKIVINAKLDDNNKAFIAFVVDPDYPNRWREEPWFSDIKKIARYGIDGVLGQTWTTIIMIKDVSIPVFAGDGRERLAVGSRMKAPAPTAP